MKFRVFVISVLMLLFLASCSNNSSNKDGENLNAQELLKQSIIDSETLLYQSVDSNDSIAIDMIAKYISYTDTYPEDSITPEYLFRAAEIAMNFKQPHNAIRYLTRIEDDYQDFDKYASSLFLKAFIFDNYTKNAENAKKYYTLFIDSFPDHKLVEDAKAALMFVGMTDEDMIGIFAEDNSN